MAALADLRFRHRGPVIAPDDGGYETARGTFNGMLDRRPELVTRPLDVEDVAAAVGYALEAGLPVAVRGGGHGVAGHCVGDDSLVVVGGEHPIAVALSQSAVGGQAVQVAIRPESLRLTLPAPTSTADPVGTVPGKVADVTFLGNIIDCHVTLDDGTRVRVQVDSAQTLEVGQRVGVRFDSQQSSVFS